MFASNRRYHWHRRKLICKFSKICALFIIVFLIATHTVLIREISNSETYSQTKYTKGRKPRLTVMEYLDLIVILF